MKVTGVIISCDHHEFYDVDKIMNYNGYCVQEKIESVDGIARAQYVKRENKISEFENIFDF